MLRQIEMITVTLVTLTSSNNFYPMRNHFLSVYLHDNIDMVTEHFKLQINFISFIKKKDNKKYKM